MSTRTDTPAVTEYLARTRAALAGLPESEVEEIIEDIGPHLAEIAGELGEDVSVAAMTERLGTPEQYASELRAAAGYPPPVPPPPRGAELAARISLWGLVIGAIALVIDGLAVADTETEPFAPFLVFILSVLLLAAVLVFTGRARMDAVTDLPESRAGRRLVAGVGDTVAGYLRSLRPAWWLLRILVLAGGLLFGIRADRGGVALMCLLGLAALLAGGARARTDARWRWVVVPANAFAAGLAIAMIGGLTTASSAAVPADQPGVPETMIPAGLYDDGRFVSNIYAFGPDGAPMREVYLYDQDGQPITTFGEGCGGMDNRFPHPRRVDGQCQEDADVPFTVAVPKPSTPSSTTPTTPPPTSK